MAYHLRAVPDKLTCSLADFLKGLHKYASVMAYGIEDFPKDHIHVYVELELGKKKQAVVKYITSKGLKGNAGYSFVLVRKTKVAMLAYIVKQGSYNVDEIDDDTLNEVWEYIQDYKKEKLDKTKPSVLKQLLELVDKEGFDKNYYSEGRVKEIIYKFHKEKEIVMIETRMRAYLLTINSRYYDDEKMINSIFQWA